MIGPSYLGLVQWAVAPDAGEDLAALAIHVSASQFHGQTYASGSLSLETAASWLVLVAAQERRLAPIAIARALHRLPALFSELPLADLDKRATGAEVAWFREELSSPRREDAYWVARDFAAGVGGTEDEGILDLLERTYTGAHSYELERIMRDTDSTIPRTFWCWSG
jgi:predicted acyl esterase